MWRQTTEVLGWRRHPQSQNYVCSKKNPTSAIPSILIDISSLYIEFIDLTTTWSCLNLSPYSNIRHFEKRMRLSARRALYQVYSIIATMPPKSFIADDNTTKINKTESFERPVHQPNEISLSSALKHHALDECTVYSAPHIRISDLCCTPFSSSTATPQKQPMV